ncbi:MAG TPA: hypothetical protein VKA73_06230 [Rubrobacter sp.]|nr:hypothetical protein [Rubrobacter sp.]
MLYGDFDPGLGRERRAQIRREVERNRLAVNLAAARPMTGAGLEKSVSRGGLAARGAAVVVALLK